MDVKAWGWNTLHDFPQIYSLEKLMLVAKDQSQSADLSQQNP